MPGVQLRTLLRREQQLDVGVALLITSRLAEVLAYVHVAKDSVGKPLDLVHRNLSPQQVLITVHGETKLAGFGTARFRGRLVRTSLSLISDQMGYLSPEEIRGEALDHRADLYGIGVLLYEMVTGQLPFQSGNIADLRERILSGSPAPAASLCTGLDPGVSDFVDGLLQADPDQRANSSRDVWKQCWALWRGLGSPLDESKLRGLVADAQHPDGPRGDGAEPAPAPST